MTSASLSVLPGGGGIELRAQGKAFAPAVCSSASCKWAKYGFDMLNHSSARSQDDGSEAGAPDGLRTIQPYKPLARMLALADRGPSGRSKYQILKRLSAMY